VRESMGVGAQFVVGDAQELLSSGGKINESKGLAFEQLFSPWAKERKGRCLRRTRRRPANTRGGGCFKKKQRSGKVAGHYSCRPRTLYTVLARKRVRSRRQQERGAGCGAGGRKSVHVRIVKKAA